MATSAQTKDIFLKALAMSGDERGRFLDGACFDAQIRKDVEGLLAAYGRAGQFLEPVSRFSGTDMYRQTPGGPERRVGKYAILERLGEGGFGVVYRAEQTEPVRRYAALKIVKLGMDTQEVLKRFEGERQAVAMMDHPNIAMIYDGGVTEGGRPYFVMELAIGDPLTEYCDRHGLGVRERLKLFLPVCRAIQHAHHKGVVHRDLKPSNVIVTLRDGEAVPKIIDFGIAKALHTHLAGATMVTSRGQFVGTPQYMSPEQTRLDAAVADTRSDVYSLGALLYELLTGTTPLESSVLKGKDLAELLQLVREGYVEKPSDRVASHHHQTTLGHVSKVRATTPERLVHTLHGQLDWVVMRAIEKDPAHRYQTAEALAADIERYLRDVPVLAGPPSRLFVVRKFAKRNKAWVAAACVTGAACVFGTALLTAGWLHARRTERDLRAQLEGAQRSIRDLEARLANPIPTSSAAPNGPR